MWAEVQQSIPKTANYCHYTYFNYSNHVNPHLVSDANPRRGEGFLVNVKLYLEIQIII